MTNATVLVQVSSCHTIIESKSLIASNHFNGETQDNTQAKGVQNEIHQHNPRIPPR